ncbi:hypothetical protein MHBO_004982, partial [Bonamia ostreae]
PDDYKQQCEELRLKIEQLSRESREREFGLKNETQNVQHQKRMEIEGLKSTIERIRLDNKQYKDVEGQLNGANRKILDLDGQKSNITNERDRLKSELKEVRGRLKDLEKQTDKLKLQQPTNGGGGGK